MFTTGLSGNEIYCLAQKGYTPINLVIGNSVYSLGIFENLGASLRIAPGKEIPQVTQLLEEGRRTAYQRMYNQITSLNTGVAGITSEMIYHDGYLEFLSQGSAIQTKNENASFSSSANGQELYAQLDAGYKPICFALGNIAYASGLSSGFFGNLKTLAQGEIKEIADHINQARHIALDRITLDAKKQNANAILGIKITLSPIGRACEILMVGTAAFHPQLPTTNDLITSGLSNIEIWNLAQMGYAPLRLLQGTSVYSLGIAGGINSILKSFSRGETTGLTKIMSDARENALAIIHDEAKNLGADDIVGIKTYVNPLGNGLLEFLAMGTAIKKIPGMKTASEQLPQQVNTLEKNNFFMGYNYFPIKHTTPLSIISRLIVIVIIVVSLIWLAVKHS